MKELCHKTKKKSVKNAKITAVIKEKGNSSKADMVVVI